MAIAQTVRFDDRERINTPVQQMRRDDLSKLVIEYDLPVNPYAKKDDLLPIVMAAEANGTFTRPPAQPAAPAERTVEHMGMRRKWCVMAGENIVTDGFTSKDEALASIG